MVDTVLENIDECRGEKSGYNDLLCCGYFKFNISDHCIVKLTKYGESILSKKDRVAFKYNYDQETHELKTQIWCIMNIFGNDVFNGAKQVIVSNEIFIMRAI